MYMKVHNAMPETASLSCLDALLTHVNEVFVGSDELKSN